MGCGASVVSVGVKPKPVEEVAINGPVDVVGGGGESKHQSASKRNDYTAYNEVEF